jgi:hypothetical protein
MNDINHREILGADVKWIELAHDTLNLCILVFVLNLEVCYLTANQVVLNTLLS